MYGLDTAGPGLNRLQGAGVPAGVFPGTVTERRRRAAQRAAASDNS